MPYLLSAFNDAFSFKKKFHGYHLLACDGSDINVPSYDDELTKVASNTVGTVYHQMHLNAVYDLLEERYTDICVQPRAYFDERDALITFIYRNPVPGKCIFIADRGYFSLNILAHLISSGHCFLLRMRDAEGKYSFLKRFNLPVEEKTFDVTINFSVTRKHSKIHMNNPDKYVFAHPCRRFDFIDDKDKESLYPLSARVVKVILPNGEPEYLLTNLSQKTFNEATLMKLYQMRWGIETSFRYLKYNVALTSFHSLKREHIMQEIYARVILYNMTILLTKCVKVQQDSRKYNCKVSVADAVITCRYFLIERVKNGTIESMLLRYLTEIRPDRSFPRKKHTKRFSGFTNRA